MSKKKNPWFKFHPAAWRGDDNLQLCSLEAQGLWINMLCMMHNEDKYGHLVRNDQPVTDTQLARLTGIDVSTVQRLKTELENNGVYSTNSKGVIFSRRMVKDENISKKRAKNGKKGAAVTNSKERENSSLPQQNSGKCRDYRVQSTEYRDKKEKNNKKEKGGYYFEGEIIKLNRDDWMDLYLAYAGPDYRRDELRLSGSLSDEFDQWLSSRDAWYSSKATTSQKSNWFMATFAAARKLHVSSERRAS